MNSHADADPFLRVPPHHIEAEQSLLGCLLISGAAYDLVVDLVEERDFYRRDHQLIWRAITDRINRQMPVDAVTVGEWFDSSEHAELVSGAYLVHLAGTTPSAASAAAYATIVRDKAILRHLIDFSTHVGALAFQPEGRTTTEVLNDVEVRLGDVTRSAHDGRATTISLSQSIRDTVREIQERHTLPATELLGASYGLRDLDEMTDGLQDTDLIILAARPAMGKTSLMLQAAESAARSRNKPALVFSLEMSASQLTHRLVARKARINTKAIRKPALISEEEWPRVFNALAELKDVPLLIDEGVGLSPIELRSRARRAFREHGGLSCICLDYIQLMQGSADTTNENRANQISEITRSLKLLAKELKVPVLALSQLNRSLEGRSDKRPVMSDLRESGSIEQDADLVLFIYRDDYYHPDGDQKGLAEIIIGKHRHGPTGIVKTRFDGNHVEFSNLTDGVDWPA